ncbi:SH3 domain-containing protein [Micromonospora fluostatini]|uniref:SH3 domain-containing protein n=1 Tax=Micromonospora fluostatini TaxID=1629071 RepID=A0ABY2DHF3_9ACTN|nr:SH3 domain-containing protein [Micromonospora fluostatini]
MRIFTMPTVRPALAGAQVALTVAAAAAVVALAPAPASAGCSHAWSDKDFGSDQVQDAGSTGLALRAGPHTGCALVTRIPNGHWVTLDCQGYGDTINSWNGWTHVRYGNGGPTCSGWVFDHYLVDGGRVVHRLLSTVRPGRRDRPGPAEGGTQWWCSSSWAVSGRFPSTLLTTWIRAAPAR